MLTAEGRWAAFCFTIPSIVVAIYLVFKLKLSIHRFVADSHYRLRCLLCLFLILNRIIDLFRLLVKLGLVSFTSQEQTGTDITESLSRNTRWYRTSFYASYYCALVTFYVNLTLILLISIDRYLRLNMIRRDMLSYWAFMSVQLVAILGSVYMIIAYGIHFIGFEILGYPEYLGNTVLYSVFRHRKQVELAIMAFGSLFYNGTTLSMMFHCIFDQGVLSVLRIVRGAPSKGPHPSSLSGSETHSIKKEPVLAESPKELKPANEVQLQASIQRDVIIASNRIRLALHMFCLWTCIIAVDIFIGVCIGVRIEGLVEHEDMVAIGLSWLVVHVALMFKLLDLFVKQLKTVQRVPSSTVLNTEPRVKHKYSWYLRRLFPSSTLQTTLDTTTNSVKESHKLDMKSSILSDYSVSLGLAETGSVQLEESRTSSLVQTCRGSYTTRATTRLSNQGSPLQDDCIFKAANTHNNAPAP